MAAIMSTDLSITVTAAVPSAEPDWWGMGCSATWSVIPCHYRSSPTAFIGTHMYIQTSK